MRKLFEKCGVCLGSGVREIISGRLVECICEEGYVPADLPAILSWCFAHQSEQFWTRVVDDCKIGCMYLERDRGECDLGLGAVVRVEDPDVK